MTGKKLIDKYNQGIRDFRNADLWGANLQGANLQDANLQRADLRCANLLGAYLRGANLLSAYLRGANLLSAYLQDANLRNANLRNANLPYANLLSAYLQDADLRGANLLGAYLQGADLQRADLTNTILDPAAQLPVITDEEITAAGFIVDGDWVTAWRTARSQVCGTTEYVPGKHYQAPCFSVDSGTDCHPGLYVASKEWLAKNYPNAPIVEVKFNKYVLLHAGDKWRVREFDVVKCSKSNRLL